MSKQQQKISAQKQTISNFETLDEVSCFLQASTFKAEQKTKLIKTANSNEQFVLSKQKDSR